MEHQVDVPGRGETQLVGHRGQHLCCRKGSVASGSQLGSRLIGAQCKGVHSLMPDLGCLGW